MSNKKLSLLIGFSFLWIYIAWKIATQSPVEVMTDFMALNLPLIIFWVYQLIKVTINKSKQTKNPST